MGDYAEGKEWKMAKRRAIMEAAYGLFSARGIEAVTMPEIAHTAGIGRATLFRYFGAKLELVVAVCAWKWDAYIRQYSGTLGEEEKAHISGGAWMRFYLDGFLDLYRNHSELLRFTYNFNSYLRHENAGAGQTAPVTGVVERLSASFGALYARGMADGTLRRDVGENVMFSGAFHIMLAATTRYAVGLVYVPENGADPESELLMLEELLLSRFVAGEEKDREGDDGE